MLELGVTHGNGGSLDIGLTPVESRSHFAAWCIVSSPLFLSHDLTDQKTNDELWPILGNPEAIAVNQAWAGHAGTLFDHPTDFAPPEPQSVSTAPGNDSTANLEDELQRTFSFRKKTDPPPPSAGRRKI